MPSQYTRDADILADQLAKVRFVVFDFDGVFTDNRVWVDSDGKESVVCSRSDGLGIEKLRELEIPMLILSTEPNTVVKRRAEKLKLECIHGVRDKAGALKDRLARDNIELVDTAFVGNDINDLACLQMVGLPVAVQDAFPEVKAAATLILDQRGGGGGGGGGGVEAVREFCDRLYAAKRCD